MSAVSEGDLDPSACCRESKVFLDYLLQELQRQGAKFRASFTSDVTQRGTSLLACERPAAIDATGQKVGLRDRYDGKSSTPDSSPYST